MCINIFFIHFYIWQTDCWTHFVRRPTGECIYGFTVVSRFYWVYLTFTFIWWFGVLSSKSRNKLLGIIRMSRRIACIAYRTSLTYKMWWLDWFREIPITHFKVSSGCFQMYRCRTNRLIHSFIPAAIKLLTEHWCYFSVFMYSLVWMFYLSTDSETNCPLGIIRILELDFGQKSHRAELSCVGLRHEALNVWQTSPS